MNPNANSKTIIVLGREDVFSGALLLFLAQKETWKIVHFIQPHSLNQIISGVDTTQSDIVVIQQKSYANDCLALEILQHFSQLKIVVVNLENNQVEVYSKQRVVAKKVSDLFALIEKENAQ